MSLQYGLNVKKTAPAPARKTLLDDDDEGDDETQNGEPVQAVESISSFRSSGASGRPKFGNGSGPPPKRRKEKEDRQDLSSAQASRSHVNAPEGIDPSIFDYDSFHDAKQSVSEAKKEAARQDAIDRKPKYINNLLDAASKRKQDQLIAREKLLQKEREAEGDYFADKEKFVTGAYKEQQEEARRLEKEESLKAEQEEKRKRQIGGGMQGFYKSMMDQRERQHQEAMEAATKMEPEGQDQPTRETKDQTDTELAAELKSQGVNVHVNEEGQITDKRELLSAGLNVAPSGKSKDNKGADHLRVSTRSAQSASQGRNDAGRQAQRERQSRMVEEQLATQAKRAREEEEEERQKLENAAKSSKTKTDVSDAKARFLARKAAKERGEG